MELLALIGILAIIALVFTGGGILGWFLKGIGMISDFLSEGWTSCLRVIVIIIGILFLLLALAL